MRRVTRQTLRWGERLLATVGLLFIVYHAGFELVAMTSDSMSPTLAGTNSEDGDRILLEKVTGWFREPRRWEIFHFIDSEGTPVTKRIVGLPGERISIRQGRVFINGTELEQPSGLAWIKYVGFGSLAREREVDCGDGYFMMGDASNDSYDSRFTGLVRSDQFRGRVFCILSPASRARFVNRR